MNRFKIYTLLLIFGLLAMIPAETFAGDFAYFKFLGFSKDGKYVAFEEWGNFDGIGGRFSHTFYIDTVKNEYALPPTLIDLYEDDISPANVRKQATQEKKLRLEAAAKLRRLRIDPTNTGDLLVAHLPNDWSYNFFSVPSGENTETVKFHNVVYANSRNEAEFYELTLKTVPAADKECSDGAYKFDLTLADKTTAEERLPQILQSDRTLPARRHCPFGYRIERVYFYEDKIAVFMQVFSQGFEGPDLCYLGVTARLADQPADKNY